MSQEEPPNEERCPTRVRNLPIDLHQEALEQQCQAAARSCLKKPSELQNKPSPKPVTEDPVQHQASATKPVKEDPKSLPDGWNEVQMEYKSGAKVGQTYKVYVNPSGKRFSSKKKAPASLNPAAEDDPRAVARGEGGGAARARAREQA